MVARTCCCFTRSPLWACFCKRPRGEFAQFAGADKRDGLVEDAKLAGYVLSDVTGDGKPELILTLKNMARALAVRDGKWVVVDQYNPESSAAMLTGIAAVEDQPGSPTLVMYDKQDNELVVFKRRSDKTYAAARTQPVGVFELSGMFAGAIGGGGKGALLLADAKVLAMLRPGETPLSFVQRHAYETDTKRGWLADAAVGDVNADGVRDIVAADTRKANLEVLTTLPSGAFDRALRFQVFQGKRFSDEPDRGGDPREILVGDVTGDRHDDIVVIAHDRVIVYPGQ